jgi:hypothetical protein
MPRGALERAREVERKRLTAKAQGDTKWIIGACAAVFCSFMLYVSNTDYLVRGAATWGAIIGTGLAVLFALSALTSLDWLRRIEEGEKPILACTRCGAPVYTAPCGQCKVI